MRFLDMIRGSKHEPSGLTLQPAGRPFHITIGTVSGEGLHIENSIRMLRSALLYADKVKLCSFTTSRVLSLFAEYGLGPEAYLDWIQEHVLPHILDERERTQRTQTIGYYKELFKRKRQGKRLDRDELQALSKIQDERGKRVEEMRNTYPVLSQSDDIRGIQRALKGNLLELHTFKSLDEQDIFSKHLSCRDVSGKEVVEEFLSVVTESIGNRATYPLFDDTTGNLLRLIVDNKVIAPSSIKVQQAKHSALAANLFERLPDFSLTPIDEIIDIRKELDESLDKFRGGISTYSERLQSAPWDKDFAAEADDLFVRQVKPAILEIEDLVKSSSNPLWHVGREISKAKGLIGGGAALGFFVDSPESLPQYVRVALGGTLPLGFAIREGIHNWRNEKRKYQSHMLYFYYRLIDKVER